ncbi:MAG TPA: YggT family protein [Candidatus Dormibacteraeota bacterium]|nr:YggT family protein [Candidatus Dormibacteraeota bacterium]
MAIEQPTPTVAPVEHIPVAEQGRYNFRAAAVVGLIVGVVDVLIAGRFLLELLGASTQSSFVSAVYGVTAPLVGPFHGIFANTGSSANVFEPAALVAIAVYAVIGWGITMLIRIATAPRGTRPVTS